MKATTIVKGRSNDLFAYDVKQNGKGNMPTVTTTLLILNREHKTIRQEGSFIFVLLGEGGYATVTSVTTC